MNLALPILKAGFGEATIPYANALSYRANIYGKWARYAERDSLRQIAQNIYAKQPRRGNNDKFQIAFEAANRNDVETATQLAEEILSEAEAQFGKKVTLTQML
ncbi:MAG: hypothetical protein HC892_11210 [Saprospiraceae bacterium]|nr:hypothetical protein [Saprospiraceae bacterium]